MSERYSQFSKGLTNLSRNTFSINSRPVEAHIENKHNKVVGREYNRYYYKDIKIQTDLSLVSENTPKISRRTTFYLNFCLRKKKY